MTEDFDDDYSDDSDGFSDDNHVNSLTSRGRDWPCLRQFIVFLENRVGVLQTFLRHVERDDLGIVSLQILDAADSAVARLVTNNYERTVELLHLSGLPFGETEVIGVILPDVEQPYVNVLTSLMSAELNVHYVYPLVYSRHGRNSIAVHVDDVDEALRVLREQNHEFVTEDDLLQGESW